MWASWRKRSVPFWFLLPTLIALILFSVYPFVSGILEAYWEAYEAVGLSLYSDYQYLREVWTYHEAIVNAIIAGDWDQGHRLLAEHTALLRYRETARPEVLAGEPAPASVSQP